MNMSSQKLTVFILSDVVFEDQTVVPVTDQTLTCQISGLSQDTPVSWVGPNDEEISESDTDNFVVNQGQYIFGSKAATLTIKAVKMASLTSGDIFKCKLKSSLYPTHSPEVVNEMNLSFFTLGTYKQYIYQRT